MRYLFAIAIVSCVALIWAAVSIARHVRKAHREGAVPPVSTTATPANSSAARAAAYSDPPVGGQRLRVHPRQDLAAGQVAATTRQRPGRMPEPATDGKSPSRYDLKYHNQELGDLSDPDTTRVSGIMPAARVSKRT